MRILSLVVLRLGNCRRLSEWWIIASLSSLWYPSYHLIHWRVTQFCLGLPRRVYSHYGVLFLNHTNKSNNFQFNIFSRGKTEAIEEHVLYWNGRLCAENLRNNRKTMSTTKAFELYLTCICNEPSHFPNFSGSVN